MQDKTFPPQKVFFDGQIYDAFDKTTLIHVDASFNHLGKKCFAFAPMDKSNIPDILARI